MRPCEPTALRDGAGPPVSRPGRDIPTTPLARHRIDGPACARQPARRPGQPFREPTPSPWEEIRLHLEVDVLAEKTRAGEPAAAWTPVSDLLLALLVGVLLLIGSGVSLHDDFRIQVSEYAVQHRHSLQTFARLPRGPPLRDA